MLLEMIRFKESPLDTVSYFKIASSFECFMLEPPFQKTKIWGKTRIPAGVYPIGLRFSPKFTPRLGHRLLHIRNIAGFRNVMIHPGNSYEDTRACQLPGQGITQAADGSNRMHNSRGAYMSLYTKIAPVITSGEPVFLEIMEDLRNG